MADPQMSVSASYSEFVPPGLLSIWHSAQPLGFGLSGILGVNGHRFGAHLSEVRLWGTGHSTDYTLHPPAAPAYRRAGAAIDLGTGPVGDGPAWAGEWLEDVRARCASGQITFLGELIGDPDLIAGPGSDAHTHLYATGPGWQWVPYEGEGHVAWCHLWVRRDRLGDTTLGQQLFAGWGRSGRTIAEGDPVADIEHTVRNMAWSIPGHTYTHLADILAALSRVVDTLVSLDYHDRLVQDVTAAVLAELRSTDPDPHPQ